MNKQKPINHMNESYHVLNCINDLLDSTEKYDEFEIINVKEGTQSFKKVSSNFELNGDMANQFNEQFDEEWDDREPDYDNGE